MNRQELKSFLDEKADLYNRPSFIEADPIQVPKQFEQNENIEIAAFLTATISWGSRPVIIRNAMKLMAMTDNDPYHFLMNATSGDLRVFSDFRHRTFNGDDCGFFIRSLRNIYHNHGSLENVILKGFNHGGTVRSALEHLHVVFFETMGDRHARKHLSEVSKGASGKRLNMFLRWMVRNDEKGVDFGLWKNIPVSSLMLPLDVHTGSVARKLGLLSRKSNDWQAVEEVTANLRQFDPVDPVRYDFALFGLGAFENF